VARRGLGGDGDGEDEEADGDDDQDMAVLLWLPDLPCSDTAEWELDESGCLDYPLSEEMHVEACQVVFNVGHDHIENIQQTTDSMVVKHVIPRLQNHLPTWNNNRQA
jgi:hypothetical protein